MYRIIIIIIPESTVQAREAETRDYHKRVIKRLWPEWIETK